MRIQGFFCIIWIALGVLPAFATTLSERVASYNLTKEQLSFH